MLLWIVIDRYERDLRSVDCLFRLWCFDIASENTMIILTTPPSSADSSTTLPAFRVSLDLLTS